MSTVGPVAGTKASIAEVTAYTKKTSMNAAFMIPCDAVANAACNEDTDVAAATDVHTHVDTVTVEALNGCHATEPEILEDALQTLSSIEGLINRELGLPVCNLSRV